MCISSSVLLPIRLSATVLPTCRRHRCILYGILTSLGYPLAFLLAMWKEHKKHWWKNSLSWDHLFSSGAPSYAITMEISTFSTLLSSNYRTGNQTEIMRKEDKKHWWKNSLSRDHLCKFIPAFRRTDVFRNSNFLYTSFHQLRDGKPHRNQSCDCYWLKEVLKVEISITRA